MDKDMSFLTIDNIDTNLEAYRLVYDPTRLLSLLYSNYGDIADRASQNGMPLEKRGFSKCFICGHKFDRAEDAYIAHVKNHINVFLCKGCANLVQAEEGE